MQFIAKVAGNNKQGIEFFANNMRIAIILEEGFLFNTNRYTFNLLDNAINKFFAAEGILTVKENNIELSYVSLVNPNSFVIGKFDKLIIPFPETREIYEFEVKERNDKNSKVITASCLITVKKKSQ